MSEYDRERDPLNIIGDHDRAIDRRGAAASAGADPEQRGGLRAALERLLDHHENTCRVSGGPGAECVVRDEARDALRGAQGGPSLDARLAATSAGADPEPKLSLTQVQEGHKGFLTSDVQPSLSITNATERVVRSDDGEVYETYQVDQEPRDARCDCAGWMVDCSCDFIPEARLLRAQGGPSLDVIQWIRERLDFDPCHECDNATIANDRLDEAEQHFGAARLPVGEPPE